ncbi:MAG: 2,3-bisphosphoglycerate-dependent phosphoglycerate mutase, partial [Paramuribaculum sp.]|nr:2,3-bisphosphoglycerate-dependent phosphoglycerate mutase [Paramuribaculum sp.]
SLTADELPLAESLKDTIARVRGCWEEVIAPKIPFYDTVLVAAHGNSLRGLAKMLLHMSANEVVDLEIPTGSPWVFELDERMNVIKEYYL